MLFAFSFPLYFQITLIKSINIPFINNTILQAGYPSNSTPLINGTCHQCLCISSLSYSALNCFPNSTCQLFSTFPPTYRIAETPGARLYFPRQTFPLNTSQCCMPNITDLLSKLNMVNMTLRNVTNPRQAIIDNHGYLVTAEEPTTSYLDRFDPTNLTRINHVLLANPQSMAVTYFNGAYYIAPYYSEMTVIDSENLTVLTNISTTTYGIRDIIFLDDGQTMVVTSCDTNSLVFLNRTSLLSNNYKFTFSQKTTFGCPHGLWRVNDSFFYVTSNTNNSLYSFKATKNYTRWNETFCFFTPKVNGTGGLTRVIIDECDRFWFASETNIISIYDQQGTQVGNWRNTNWSVFDIKIMDNYLMYLSDSRMNRIIRIDPKIQCWL
jgi:hypothetical protein